MQEIKVALLGFGGIAASHKVAYDALYNDGSGVRLVAICDKNGSFEKRDVVTNLGTVNTGSLEGIELYTSFEEMLEKCDFDMVDICLPTFLHKEFTVAALGVGKHVLCEKPMALSSEDCADMVNAARLANKQLMIGQCLRFDECYRYLREIKMSGKYGKPRRAFMSRLSPLPSWGAGDIYKKISLTGGCTMDLHIHDLDMMRFVFGDPKAISSVEYLKESGHQYISSRLFYTDMLAEAEASFDESVTTPFSMGYRVRFEQATVIFDEKGVVVYPDEGVPYSPELSDKDRIAEEIRYFCECIRTGENKDNSPTDTSLSIRLALAANESAKSGGSLIKLG